MIGTTVNDETFWAAGMGWSANEHDNTATYCVIDIEPALYKTIKHIQAQILNCLGLSETPVTSFVIGIFDYSVCFFEYHLPPERNEGEWHFVDEALTDIRDARVDPTDQVSENVTRTECERLMVTHDDIYFEAAPKYGQGEYTSFRVPIAALDAHFTGATE